MSRITVILPNYNHARYLPRRIESILSQTLGEFELLILDNKSLDDSREVIARYQTDPRVRAVFNETNSGSPYLQWRLGLSLSRSEYVWIAESDDYSEPVFLERLVAILDRNPNVGFAYADSLAVDEDDRPLHYCLDGFKRSPHYAEYDFSVFERDFVMSGREYCARYMYPWITILNASAAVFRRSALEAAGGPVTDMRICGDWMTYVNLFMNSDVAWVRDPLNRFRQHRSTVRSRTRGVDYVRETRIVQDAIVRALGVSREPLRRDLVISYFAQALLLNERRPPHLKVPLSRAFTVLRDATRCGPRVLTRTAGILAFEGAADVARRLGIRKRPAETV